MTPLRVAIVARKETVTNKGMRVGYARVSTAGQKLDRSPDPLWTSLISCKSLRSKTSIWWCWTRGSTRHRFMAVCNSIFLPLSENLKGIIRERIFPFFAYLKDIRKVICTTNAIESLNMSLRKVTKNRGSFPNDAAMCKRLYLALHNIAKKWTMPIRDWKAALNQFSIIFEGRLPVY